MSSLPHPISWSLSFGSQAAASKWFLSVWHRPGEQRHAKAFPPTTARRHETVIIGAYHYAIATRVR